MDRSLLQMQRSFIAVLTLVTPLVFLQSALLGEESNSAQYFEQGLRLAKKSDFKQAVAEFTNAINLDPKNVDAYCARSQAEFPYLMDDKGALNDLTQAVTIDPKRISTYFLRAKLLSWYAIGSDGAIADLTRVIELDPKNARAYLWRASIKEEKDDSDGAIADLTAAIKYDPKDAYAERARIDGTPADAIADFNRAIALDPKNDQLYESRAEKELPGSPASAMADYTSAIRISRKNSSGPLGELYDDRGAIKQYEGDLRGALSDYTEAIRAGDYRGNHGSNKTPFYHRGIVRELMGNLNAASADIQCYADSHIAHYVRGDDTGLHDSAEVDLWVVSARLGKMKQADRRLSDYLEKRQKREPPYDHCNPELTPESTGLTAMCSFLLQSVGESELPDRIGSQQYYYCAGMKRLIDGNREAAIDLFKKAAASQRSQCPYNDNNLELADAELNALEKLERAKTN